MADDSELLPAVPASTAVAVPALATEEEIDQLRQTATAAYAENTRLAYEGAWARFGEWCDQRQATQLPADPGSVALFLRTVRTADGREALPTVGTLGLYRAVIHRAHTRAGLASPLEDERVREIWRGLRRERGGAATQGAAALTLDDLERIVPRLPATPLGIRDRALLVVGVAAALRRSELVKLQIGDAAFTDSGITLTIRKSKTDQEGQGAVLGLPQTHDPVLCPVAALRTWLEQLLRARARLSNEASIFRGINAGRVSSTAMHPDSVNKAVKRCVQLVGLDPAGYSAHSLRVGFVTSADALGLTVGEIKAQSRHKTSAMILHYTRHDRALRDSPVARMFTGSRKRD